MKVLSVEKKLSQVDPSYRVLLLSQCLRPSQGCPGKFNRTGLVCPENCAEDCVLKRFREAALSLGYKGVCIAAGGAMALRFVKEHAPQAIVAIACEKELAEGIEGVESMMGGEQEAPAIVTIPLTRDGCVDTEVDEKQALNAIISGCSP